ncbi:hypothetical protein [Nonomuraea sp. NPDC050310]|uniref:hypothetical protein n=1 Tax=Nonomuraea sp. NPDC050310 TaxID=3154935 RepID=UPI0033DA3C06
MPDRGDEICVLDAVICVHFVGANLHPLLIDVLTKAGLVLLVPHEVCEEVAGKDGKYPGLRQRWARLAASGRIEVLPALELATAAPRVVEVIEEIRGLDLEQAVRARRDLGEVVVVAHSVHLAELGHEVIAALDDQEGQRLAARWNIPVLSIEDVLTLAIELGHFPSIAELRRGYARLRAFGDGLVPLEKTSLVEVHRRWLRTDATARVPAQVEEAGPSQGGTPPASGPQ